MKPFDKRKSLQIDNAKQKAERGSHLWRIILRWFEWRAMGGRL